ncbi:MAG TPA: flagellar motor switch protein FliG [Vicinamibacterales bacterium]|nr:flagellar motor switch protein FliG [Vicinamibacterales bacterium]
MQAAPHHMTGVRKVAIILMALGEESSGTVFKYLQEEEIERVVREIASLGTVPTEVGEGVLTELHDTVIAASHMATGGVEQARRILSKTMSPDQCRRILDRVIHSFSTIAGFASLEKANPQQLSKFILGEHPQTVALILAHLNPGSAAQLITQLPDEMRAEVLMRMASLEDISPDVISRVSGVIDQRLKALGGPSRQQRGGVRAVAELFNRLDRGVSRPTLEHMESSSPEMAHAIRNLMFVFEDLINVEDTGIREIVNRSDKKALTVALKGSSEEIRTRFFGNMSKRAADLLKEEMEVLGAVRLRDVEKAQQEIVAIARKLEEEGVITTGAEAGEPYVN